MFTGVFLIMTAQDQERIEGQTSATNTATLMQNAGTKFAGRIVSDDKTARTVKNAAGEEARARMGSLQRHDGVMGESWVDGNQITIQMESKIDVQDLIRLNAGEFFTVFQGMWCRQPLCIFRTARKVATVIRWSSTAIFPLKPPAGASPPSRPQDSAAQAPHTGACQQHHRCTDSKTIP